MFNTHTEHKGRHGHRPCPLCKATEMDRPALLFDAYIQFPHFWACMMTLYKTWASLAQTVVWGSRENPQLPRQFPNTAYSQYWLVRVWLRLGFQSLVIYCVSQVSHSAWLTNAPSKVLESTLKSNVTLKSYLATRHHFYSSVLKYFFEVCLIFPIIHPRTLILRLGWWLSS